MPCCAFVKLLRCARASEHNPLGCRARRGGSAQPGAEQRSGGSAQPGDQVLHRVPHGPCQPSERPQIPGDQARFGNPPSGPSSPRTAPFPQSRAPLGAWRGGRSGSGLGCRQRAGGGDSLGPSLCPVPRGRPRSAAGVRARAGSPLLPIWLSAARGLRSRPGLAFQPFGGREDPGDEWAGEGRSLPP